MKTTLVAMPQDLPGSVERTETAKSRCAVDG
jgi:hypothetical protein